MGKIYEEDARVRQKEMEKKQERREYIEEFQRQQAHWNALEKQRLAAEAENIKKYAEQQDIRAAERQQKRKEANAALAQVQQNLAQELEEKQRAKEEYENIVQELVLAEQEEKDRMKEIREFEKQLRSKVELQRNHR